MKFETFCNNPINEEIEEISLIDEGIHDTGIFKAVFMAGQGGSGKSYVASKINVGGVSTRVINTDTWVEYFGNSYKDFADNSRILSLSQLSLYLSSMLPLLIDTTSTSMKSLLNRKNLLERIGYDTAMIFVNTSLETSLERISKRARKVPTEVVIDYYDRVNKNKPKMKSMFDLFLEVNNNDEDLTDEVIQKLFKRMMFFYTSPVKNPVGIRHIDEMKSKGLKYLTPEIYTQEQMKKMSNIWHKK